MKTRDKIHYTTRKIDGYNLPFNFIISEREAGKSTAIWLDKVYKAFREKGQSSIVIRRKVVHITKSYIDDIAKIINKFTDDKVIFSYAISTIKDGIVDIYIGDKFFVRIIALSVDITAVKSQVIIDLAYIIFDEFICNARFGEKYLKDEAIKFNEVFNTFLRESEKLKCYFLGNPYSLFNPYFIFFNVPTSRLHKGAIFSDNKSYVVECYQITEELRAHILAKNPLYQFDNAYTKYAFDGLNVNDQNIIICNERPQNYSLHIIFKVQSKFIAVWRNNTYYLDDMRYYCEFIDIVNVSKRRDIYAFDLDELVEHVVILSRDERIKFQKFKDSIRRREVAFNSIECYYLCEEVYFNLWVYSIYI